MEAIWVVLIGASAPFKSPDGSRFALPVAKHTEYLSAHTAHPMGSVSRATCFYGPEHGQQIRSSDFRQGFTPDGGKDIVFQPCEYFFNVTLPPLRGKPHVPFTCNRFKGFLLSKNSLSLFPPCLPRVNALRNKMASLFPFLTCLDKGNFPGTHQKTTSSPCPHSDT